MSVGEDLLDASLICTLGGEYELTGSGASPVWHSTAWPASVNYSLPEDYTSTLLSWFRGLDASLVKEGNQAIVRAHVDVQRKEQEPGLSLPTFNLFGGGQDAAPE